MLRIPILKRPAAVAPKSPPRAEPPAEPLPLAVPENESLPPPRPAVGESGSIASVPTRPVKIDGVIVHLPVARTVSLRQVYWGTTDPLQSYHNSTARLQRLPGGIYGPRTR